MKHSLLPTLAIAAAVGLLALAPAARGALVNGGFETPAIGPATFQNIVVGAEPAGFAWTVTNDNVDLFSNGVLSTTAVAYEGVQALDLVGFGSAGGVSQSMSTTLGTTYRLRFAYANNPISTGGASARIDITDGATALLARSVTHATSTTSDFDWDLFEATFVGTGNAVTLRFVNTVGQNNGGVFLDAVSVDVVPPSQVPLPPTLALAALALLCARGTRRPARRG